MLLKLGDIPVDPPSQSGCMHGNGWHIVTTGISGGKLTTRAWCESCGERVPVPEGMRVEWVNDVTEVTPGSYLAPQPTERTDAK